jgi:magnesium chelatase family protein
MRVFSFIRQADEIKRVEVELSLLPGLPQISFLGLPDAALKESILRIRSAIKEQGFQLPQAHQVIVQIWPTHLRKSSQGLDLAVAAALLWETGQLPLPTSGSLPVLYGELSLKGRVLQPTDLEDLPRELASECLTGPGPGRLPFVTKQIGELKQLHEPSSVEASLQRTQYERPSVKVGEFAKPAAELAMLIAAGEFPTLFAGPPGSGKSTLAEAIPSWLCEPSESEFVIADRLAKRAGQKLKWRPVIQPHHSITPLAMIGGGSALWSGEISRAHSGVLILDELLEFHPQVQEALREPVETGTLSIARAGRVRQFPARVLLLATTNLCPCGRFVPRRESSECRCSRARRVNALARLSGPFLDRFAFLGLTDIWLDHTEVIACSKIAERVFQAICFRKDVRKQAVPNNYAETDPFESELTTFQRRHGLNALAMSRRRRIFVLRTARTLADLEQRERISGDDLERALVLCLENHRLIQEWRE